MNENAINELIESFVAYREMISPIRDSLADVSRSYKEIGDDLDALSKNLNAGSLDRLEKVHSSLAAQAKNGQELARRLSEYAQAGEKYAQAVDEMSTLFSGLASRMTSLEETENAARRQIEKIDGLIDEKKAPYNLKDLQKSLDRYSVNIEKISDFINRDIAAVMKQNADKIENIRKENEDLKEVVLQQSRDIAALTEMFRETTALLKNVVEGSTVNEQYIFDAFDKWAADRKVKIKKS